MEPQIGIILNSKGLSFVYLLLIQNSQACGSSLQASSFERIQAVATIASLGLNGEVKSAADPQIAQGLR
ncbi:MAG TPA: hypothetical protein VLS96_16750 [Nodosilinea sp.]|nr:hypothetical protein [Nodosilinea sp.]